VSQQRSIPAVDGDAVPSSPGGCVGSKVEPAGDVFQVHPTPSGGGQAPDPGQKKDTGGRIMLRGLDQQSPVTEV